MPVDIVVVGSLNFDISVLTRRFPQPGETLVGSGHFSGPGGKGANQAVAAARLGAAVAMVGRVGDDTHGQTLVELLIEEGVDVSGVGWDPEAGTGMALITIDEHAENTIVVSPGANMRLSPAHILEHESLIAAAGIVIAQLEVSVESVMAAAQVCTGSFILNPAPARPLPDRLLERVDLLVPNRSELGALAGGDEVARTSEVVAAARSLHHRGFTVVTLGSEGALLVEEDGVVSFPAHFVDAVDPTGAGDAFCGALAYSLSRGLTVREAVEWATAAGAVAVTRQGAQAGMPTREEVEALLAR